MKERNIIEELMEEKQLTLHQIAKLIDYDVAVVSRVKIVFKRCRIEWHLRLVKLLVMT